MLGPAWTTVGDTDGVVAGAGVGDARVGGVTVGDKTAVEAQADSISAPRARLNKAIPRESRDGHTTGSLQPGR
jgi:hypothetical protein